MRCAYLTSRDNHDYAESRSPRTRRCPSHFGRASVVTSHRGWRKRSIARARTATGRGVTPTEATAALGSATIEECRRQLSSSYGLYQRQVLRYSLILDSDDDRFWLTIRLPTLRGRPRLQFLRTVAEVYSLAPELNANGQQRFGVDVVAVRMDSSDGDISITFEFDPDFSDGYLWRDQIAASVARIVAKPGKPACGCTLRYRGPLDRDVRPRTSGTCRVIHGPGSILDLSSRRWGQDRATGARVSVESGARPCAGRSPCIGWYSGSRGRITTGVPPHPDAGC